MYGILQYDMAPFDKYNAVQYNVIAYRKASNNMPHVS